MAESISQKGQKGDTVVGHLTKGEVVIPKAFMEDKDFKSFVGGFMKANGADINKFTVGSNSNSVNPKTGYVEFGWFSKVKKSVSGLFGGKAPKIPDPPPPPDPVATSVREDTGGMTDAGYAPTRTGKSSAFLTGSLVPESTGKKRFFG